VLTDLVTEVGQCSQAKDLVGKEQQKSAALEREVSKLKQAKEAGVSAQSRAAVLEQHSQDIQSKLQQTQAERDLNQGELLEARKELKKLACSLDEERRLNASLCNQAKTLNANVNVRSKLMCSRGHVQCPVEQLQTYCRKKAIISSSASVCMLLEGKN
jgi:chromosome segregation ATPase